MPKQKGRHWTEEQIAKCQGRLNKAPADGEVFGEKEQGEVEERCPAEARCPGDFNYPQGTSCQSVRQSPAALLGL